MLSEEEPVCNLSDRVLNKKWVALDGLLTEIVRICNDDLGCEILESDFLSLCPQLNTGTNDNKKEGDKIGN